MLLQSLAFLSLSLNICASVAPHLVKQTPSKVKLRRKQEMTLRKTYCYKLWEANEWKNRELNVKTLSQKQCRATVTLTALFLIRVPHT